MTSCTFSPLVAFSWFTDNPVLAAIWPHAVMVAVLFALAGIIDLGLIQYAKMIANRWIEPLQLGDGAHANPSPVKLKTHPGVDVSDSQLERLNEQLTDANLRMASHLNIMTFFFTRYFAAIAMISVFGAGAAVLLLLVTQKGWTAAHPLMLTALFVTTAIAVFYRAVPASFQQQQNITENKALLLRYMALEQDVRSFVVTGQLRQGLTATVNPTTNEFISYVDQQLAQDNVAVGFDDKVSPDYKAALTALKT